MTLPPSFLLLALLFPSFLPSSLPSLLPSFPFFLPPQFVPSSLTSLLPSSLPSSLLFLPFASFLPPSFLFLTLAYFLSSFFLFSLSLLVPFLFLPPSLPSTQIQCFVLGTGSSKRTFAGSYCLGLVLWLCISLSVYFFPLLLSVCRIFSGGPWIRKFGYLSIRENFGSLVTVRPSVRNTSKPMSYFSSYCGSLQPDTAHPCFG